MKRKGSQFGGQLKMFMTPREIQAEYSPLDADREVQEVYERAGTSTRAEVSAGRWSQLPRNPEVFRTAGGSQFKHVGESDEDVWNRKLEESTETYHDRAIDRGDIFGALFDAPRSSAPQLTFGGSSGRGSVSKMASHERHMESYEDRKWQEQQRTLYDEVQERGVEAPVSLGTERSVVTGKKQVVGGHHRIAAASNINSDQFVPVLHFTDIHEARRTKAWKYT